MIAILLLHLRVYSSMPTLRRRRRFEATTETAALRFKRSNRVAVTPLGTLVLRDPLVTHSLPSGARPPRANATPGTWTRGRVNAA